VYLRIGTSGGELISVEEASVREDLHELRRGSRGGVGGGQSGFGPYNGAGEPLGMQCGRGEERQEHSGSQQNPGGMSHGRFSQSGEKW
jgi:hypothetical protein